MYCNKKRTNSIALLGAVLLLEICGCGIEAPEQKQENVSGTVTEATVQEEEEITQTVINGTVGTDGELELADATEEKEPEEQIIRLLTEAEDLYFISGGVMSTELLGYVEEKDASYFIMKKQSDLRYGGEMLYIGVMSPDADELIQCRTYGNTTADAVMIEKETEIYIIYATECTDFGLYSGQGGILLAKDGTLTQVWPLTADGEYDGDYWNQHTARLNGETLEIHKVVVTEVSPGGTAICTTTELERTVTLKELGKQ